MRTMAEIVADLEEHKQAIAHHRDKLRELESEIGEIVESGDRGLESLEHALDALSEYL